VLFDGRCVVNFLNHLPIRGNAVHSVGGLWRRARRRAGLRGHLQTHARSLRGKPFREAHNVRAVSADRENLMDQVREHGRKEALFVRGHGIMESCYRSNGAGLTIGVVLAVPIVMQAHQIA